MCFSSMLMHYSKNVTNKVTSPSPLKMIIHKLFDDGVEQNIKDQRNKLVTKTASSLSRGVLNHQQECKDVQRHIHHFLHIGYYHIVTNHTTYVHRGDTSTVHFTFKSRTGSTSGDTTNSQKQRPMNRNSDK